MTLDFHPGDNIRWRYRHHLNSKSSFVTHKDGVFVGYVRHRGDYRGPRLARVRFLGNAGESRVPVSELKLQLNRSGAHGRREMLFSILRRVNEISNVLDIPSHGSDLQDDKTVSLFLAFHSGKMFEPETFRRRFLKLAPASLGISSLDAYKSTKRKEKGLVVVFRF